MIDREPLISVVLPVFDAERYVTAAVESVLGQTVGDFELILINDGSRDGSATILDGFAARDERVQVVHQENRGLIETLNRGVSLARGRYLARMDADDISPADRFEKQLTCLERRPEIAVLSGAAQYIDDEGPLPYFVRQPLDPAAVKNALSTSSCVIHAAAMMRLDALRAVGGYRRAFVHAEDYDLWLRLVERADLANLPDVLLYIRLHQEQVSEKHLFQQVLSTLGAQAAARRRRAGELDPCDEWNAIGLDELERLGVGWSDIERGLVAGYAHRAFVRASLGRPWIAEGLLGDVESRLRSAPARRRVRAEAAWLRVRRRFVEGGPWRGALALAGACLERPSLTLRAARAAGRRLLGRRSAARRDRAPFRP